MAVEVDALHIVNDAHCFGTHHIEFSATSRSTR